MKSFKIIILVFLSNICFGQPISLSHYNEFKSKPDTCQINNLFYYCENSTKSFNGLIANQRVYMFFEFFNDSTINGFYRYDKYNKNITISGKFKKDSIVMYELDKDSKRVALMRVNYCNDSLLGNWYSLKDKKEFKVRLVQMNRTGDVFTPNLNFGNNLNLVLNNCTYTIPLSNYLDSSFNYAFDVLFKEKINNSVIFIARFWNYPLYPIAVDKYGWSATDQFLMFAKFKIKGESDTMQIFQLSSDIKNIDDVVNYGSTSKEFIDSLNIDIYYRNEKIKNNLVISLNKIEKGIIFQQTKTDIPNLLYDTLKINTDDNFQLVIRYKLSDIYSNNYYTYKVDSVYEKNNKNISKLSSFCNDLKAYSASVNNGKISYGDYKDITIDDYNFDGYNDIYIFNYEEAGVNNRAQTIWLYDLKSDTYKKDSFLSNLNIWSIDKTKKIIISGWRTGAQIYNTISYQLINGNFKKVETEESRRDDTNNTVTVIISKLVNDKWVKEKKTY